MVENLANAIICKDNFFTRQYKMIKFTDEDGISHTFYPALQPRQAESKPLDELIKGKPTLDIINQCLSCGHSQSAIKDFLDKPQKQTKVKVSSKKQASK